MLILSRRKDESIMIGDDIKIKILESSYGQVKIGIEAPRATQVHREEVHKRIKIEGSKRG